MSKNKKRGKTNKKFTVLDFSSKPIFEGKNRGFPPFSLERLDRSSSKIFSKYFDEIGVRVFFSSRWNFEPVTTFAQLNKIYHPESFINFRRPVLSPLKTYTKLQSSKLEKIWASPSLMAAPPMYYEDDAFYSFLP